ncbi:MAG: hypothetical protein Q9172_007177, partial [Xanthocarpia lactea]
PSKEGTRRSKRQRHEEPEYIPQVSPQPKRRKTSPPTEQPTQPAPSAGKPKKPSAPRRLEDLPRIAPSQEPTPIASPFGHQRLNRDYERNLHWSFMDTPLYKNGSVKDACHMNRAAGMPFEKNWKKAGGVAFVRCFRLPGHDLGAGEGQYLEGSKTAARVCVTPVVQDLWVGKRAQVSWDNQVSMLPSTTKRGKAASTLKARRAAEFFRVGEGEEEKEFYLWWEDSRGIRVNGILVLGEDDSEIAVGPLPDFAVIQIEDTIIFFWKNEAALDFTPPSIETDETRIKEMQAEEEAKRQAAEEAKKKESEAKAAEEAKRQEDERIAEEQLDEDLLGENNQESGSQALADQGTQQSVNNPPELTEEEQEKRRLRWQAYWEHGVRNHERRRNQHQSTGCQQIGGSENLLNEEIVLCIATVWDAVVTKLKRPFAFNEDNAYQLVRSSFEDAKGFRDKVVAAVHGPNDLVIPILMDGHYISPPNSAGFPPGQNPNKEEDPNEEEDPNKQTSEPPKAVGSDGHIMLAIAQLIRKDANAGDQVRMIVMDSRPGTKSDERISNNVSKTVRRIGWLGMDREGYQSENRDTPPRVTQTHRIPVPHQVSVNCCGIHTILNAWGYMLRLPALNDVKRSVSSQYTTEEQLAEEEWRFIEDATKMINLALAGHMDLHTIQAFFNYYGFCQLQDPTSSTEKQENITTTMMNGSILLEILDRQRTIEMVGGATPTRNQFPESAVRAIIDVAPGYRYSQAVQLLDSADGDANKAVELALYDS